MEAKHDYDALLFILRDRGLWGIESLSTFYLRNRLTSRIDDAMFLS